MSMPGPVGGGPRTPAPQVGGGGATNVPTRRNTRIYLLLALLLASVTVFFVFVVLGTSSPEGIYVFRAKEAVSARQQLTPALFEVVAVQEDDLVAGAYRASSKEDLEKEVTFDNLVTRYPIARGAQLTVDAAGAVEEIDTVLQPGERLISVEASLADSAAGIIRPGDTIDLFAAVALGGGDAASNVVQMVVASAEVITVTVSASQLEAAASRQAGEAGPDAEAGDRGDYLPGDPIPGVYLIKVQVSDLPKVLAAVEWTKLYIAYRGQSAGIDITAPATLIQAMCGVPAVPAGVEAPSIETVPLPAVCPVGG